MVCVCVCACVCTYVCMFVCVRVFVCKVGGYGFCGYSFISQFCRFCL